jgi:hypothetical protein
VQFRILDFDAGSSVFFAVSFNLLLNFPFEVLFLLCWNVSTFKLRSVVYTSNFCVIKHSSNTGWGNSTFYFIVWTSFDVTKIRCTKQAYKAGRYSRCLPHLVFDWLVHSLANQVCDVTITRSNFQETVDKLWNLNRKFSKIQAKNRIENWKGN